MGSRSHFTSMRRDETVWLMNPYRPVDSLSFNLDAVLVHLAFSKAEPDTMNLVALLAHQSPRPLLRPAVDFDPVLECLLTDITLGFSFKRHCSFLC